MVGLEGARISARNVMPDHGMVAMSVRNAPFRGKYSSMSGEHSPLRGNNSWFGAIYVVRSR